MFKISLVLFIVVELFSTPIVMVSKKNIQWKHIIKRSDIYLIEALVRKYQCKEYLNPDSLITNIYRAKHYISKGRKICKKDLYKDVEHKVTFNFGLLEIEKNGEIVKETDQYIKIRNNNGEIEKIYKVGSKQ